MIRICLAAAAALLVAGCAKAPEDVTARYTIGEGQGTVTVKAAGNGDARIDSNGQTLIRHGGTDYLIAGDSQGRFAASIGDFAGAMGELLRESGVKPGPLGPQPEYVLAKQGKETIGGVEGDVWTVQAKNIPATAAGAAADAVISPDPALAHVGKAMQIQTRLGMASMEQVQGGASSLDKAIEELLGKGMVLRFGPAIKLDKIERGPIDASNFALPEKVLDKAALKTRLVAERARMQAMQQRAPSATAPMPAPAPAPAQPQPQPQLQPK